MKAQEMAQRVFELNQSQKQIEKELQQLKEALKLVGSGKYGEFVVTIENRERETFAINEARNTISRALWLKIQGFIKLTTYQQVRVVRR